MSKYKKIVFDMGEGRVETYICDSIKQAEESKYLVFHTTKGETIGVNLEAIYKFIITDVNTAGNSATEFMSEKQGDEDIPFK